MGSALCERNRSNASPGGIERRSGSGGGDTCGESFKYGKLFVIYRTYRREIIEALKKSGSKISAADVPIIKIMLKEESELISEYLYYAVKNKKIGEKMADKIKGVGKEN